ncbi:hypothetical protein HCN44_006567 [Aphidius gifuensis]|uniref:Neprilysin n=1 Tax=Aphidius gifuensis TaxID=684658 RepID=A0A834XXR2_APHGI|nr:neprilysin-2-like [Aphidius gifuensis]KAF7995460.1 hypothetical protein HCN44_006567 [Aphidius gifuensis]
MIFLYHQSNAVALRKKRADVHVPMNIDTTNPDVCTTKTCNEAAALLSKNMDTSVNPCDDFYAYTCGGFINSTIIPDDKKTIGIFGLINDRIQKQLRMTLNDTSESSSNDPRYAKLAKKLYKICMNQDVDEDQSNATLMNYLDQIGGWPILKGKQWNETLFDWKKNIIKVNKNTSFWLMSYFKLDVVMDIMNNSQHVIYLNGFFPGVSRKYMLNGFDDKHVKNYFNYMVNVSVAMGADKISAQTELKQVLDFEIKLAELTHALEETQKTTTIYNPITLGQLTNLSTFFPWKEYINYHLNISITDDEIIIVSNVNFFVSLGELIDTVPKKVLANFEAWKLIQSTAMHMNGEIKNIQKNYKMIQTGALKSEEKWIECVKILSSQMSIATSALYVHKNFDKNNKYNVNTLVENLQNQYVKNLENISWMDNVTRSRAVDKARKIGRSIAYPDELLNASKVNELYDEMEFTGDTYLENIIILNCHNKMQKWKSLRKITDQSYWMIFGNSVHLGQAFYYSLFNRIILPAGILQGEFYNNDLPSFMNYARIGMITGHEIAHGFDEMGKIFDGNGNLFDWWEESTSKKYHEKIKCIVKQYGNYTVKQVGMKINGSTTKEENFADNGGVKIAYLAYNDWLIKNYNLEQKLSGFLNFTSRQMFWISYGSTWCEKSRTEFLIHSINIGAHCPHEFRVSGPLSNLDEFSKDFKCPVGSKMNPKTKCTVW